MKTNAFVRAAAVIILFCQAGAAWAADEIPQIKSKGVLVVGVKADYPPFGYRSPDGQITGIEPDLATDAAKRLGVKVELVPVIASNRIQFLQQGKIDVMIATMSVTEERAKLVDFVKPSYYASGYNLMLPKSMMAKAWDDVKGKQICAIQGAYYNKDAAEKYNLDLVAFRGQAEALTALQQGRCVGFLYDDTGIAANLLAPEWKDYDMPLPSLDSQPWGIAVRLGATDLANALGAMVQDWAKKGTILALETKYGLKKHSEFAEDMNKKAQ